MVAQILALSLLGKLLGGQVIAALVLADQQVLHDQDNHARGHHHAAADGVATNVSTSSVVGAVDLATDSTTNVTKRDNGSSGNTALGVATNVGGEPRQHGGDTGKHTAGSDSQRDVASSGRRVLGDDQENVADTSDKSGEGVMDTTLTEAIGREGKSDSEETCNDVGGGSHHLGGQGTKVESLNDRGDKERERVERGGVEDVCKHVEVHLPVGEHHAELLPGEGGLVGWAGIDLETGDGQHLLLFGQEASSLGEVGQEVPDHNGQQDRGKTLQNKDPLPSYSNGVVLGKAI